MKGTKGTDAAPRGLRRMGRRLVTTGAVGLCLVVMAGTAHAGSQQFGPSNDRGLISASVACRQGGNRPVNISVSATTPFVYRNGLYFYLQIFAKAHSGNQWTKYVDGSTGLIKSWTTYRPDPYGSPGSWGWMNSPVTLDARQVFNGARGGQYDFHVRYWWKVPGGSWSAQHDLPVTSYTTYDQWGLGSSSPFCMT